MIRPTATTVVSFVGFLRAEENEATALFSYSSDTHVSLSKKIWWFDGLENARMTKVLRKGNRPNSGKMNFRRRKRNGPEPQNVGVDLRSLFRSQAAR
jgi:hypothetical protein